LIKKKGKKKNDLIQLSRFFATGTTLKNDALGPQRRFILRIINLSSGHDTIPVLDIKTAKQPTDKLVIPNSKTKQVISNSKSKP